MTNIIKPLLSLLLFCGAAVLSAADTPVKHTSFKPGEIWTDNNGVHINAHGGGILYDKGTSPRGASWNAPKWFTTRRPKST
ncbi:MAG: hypothetical protein E7K26_06540 [Akkermansia sp.]|nr:hypothetical protein [Akkermansia sp.]MDU7625325.1 hypothetical protein [Akkermansia sp.]